MALCNLHVSSNQGASCFAHLLGFRLMVDRVVCVFTTPAFFASAIRNASTFVVRSSLSS
jgi:hypothetical protein